MGCGFLGAGLLLLVCRGFSGPASINSALCLRESEKKVEELLGCWRSEISRFPSLRGAYLFSPRHAGLFMKVVA